MPITAHVTGPQGWDRYAKQLRELNKRGLGYAYSATLNDVAFAGRKKWQSELPGAMKLRNTYTTRSIRVERASPGRLQSVMGSVADYMGTQEEGATETKKGKHGVPLPAAAPGKRKKRGRISKNRTLGAIQVMPSVQGHRSRQVVVALAMAKKKGGPQYAFLKLKAGRRGLYKIDPTKKRAAIRKVWDLSKSSVRIPANPTMKPSALAVLSKVQRYWGKNIAFQLKRVGAR